MALKRKTVKSAVFFQGIAVHTGNPVSLTILPNFSQKNNPLAGIVFQNSNFPLENIIIGTVVPENAMHATVIKQQHWFVSTIEHLMAAFHVLGVSQVYVQMAAPEVPILDGSALPFVHEILEVGLQDLPDNAEFLTPRNPVTFTDAQGRFLEIEPATTKKLHIDYTADFTNPLLGTSHFVGEITPEIFTKEIAPARTFGFLEQLPMLKQHGLARGSSLGNSLVIGPEEFLNDRRFPDECVRHKVLDLLGDLALLGKPLAGKVRAIKTGHNFNRLAVEHYLKNPELWDLI